MAHLRRESRRAGSTKIRFEDDLVIDYAAHTVSINGKEVALAKKEFEIIELLSGYRGQVFDKERIYERLWGYDAEGDSAVIAEHIKRIRAKLKLAGAEEHIETVWGVGYKWK
jgi:DNA-binding response OmpR family regulator